MPGRGLLSRIAGASPVDDAESIAAHLRALLNTRCGGAVAAPRYGVTDFADLAHAFPGATAELARSIRATILEFEPRLRNVSVRQLPGEGGLSLRFEINAQLAREHGSRHLRFATTVRPGGRVDVL
jgi:type VI secretion system protein